MSELYKDAPSHIAAHGKLDDDGKECLEGMTIYPNVDPETMATALLENFSPEWIEEFKRIL